MHSRSSCWPRQAGLPVTAKADIRNANNQPAGTATLTEAPGGVRIIVQVKGLPPGPHGLHIHEVGKCEAPKFTTAGGHFNPEKKQHGTLNPAGNGWLETTGARGSWSRTAPCRRGTPDHRRPSHHFVDIGTTFHRKVAAVRAHASQWGRHPDLEGFLRTRAQRLGERQSMALAEGFKRLVPT